MAYQPTSNDKTMGMLSHLLAALTGWVGPLILFLVKKDESPFIKLHSKQALVWGITMSILYVVGSMTLVIIIGCVILPAVLVVHLVFTIMGAVKVNKGEKFIYPVVANWFCKDEIAAVYGDSASGPTPPPPAGPTPPTPTA